MKKAARWIAIGVPGLLVVAAVGLSLFGGAMIKGGINTFGPAVMGVPVTLERATFRPFSGRVQLTKLHVGNPEGFKTPALFELGDVDVELNARSLFGDTIVIHAILVNAPEITYERGLLASNFSKLLDQMQGGGKPADARMPEEQPEQKPAGGGKKVIIETLVVRDPKLNVSITAAGGHYIPVALGQVEMKDIGRKSGGATFADAMKVVFSVLTQNIENAVTGAGDLIGSGVKTAGKAAGEGVKAAGGALSDGAAAAGGAISEGASAVGKTLGGLLGGKKDAAQKEPVNLK